MAQSVETYKPMVPSSNPTLDDLFDAFLFIVFVHVKHRKREPEGVHGQLEGCNRNFAGEGRCGRRVSRQKYGG